MVSVLKGSVVFMADLMRAVDCPARIDFMSVSSYGSGTKTSGVVKIVKDLDLNLEGYDLLLVEDILDSGRTLYYLREILEKRNPASIRIATLLNKPARREAILRLTIPVLKYRTNSSSDMGWTTRRNTATCPISGCSNQKYIQNNATSIVKSFKIGVNIWCRENQKELSCTWRCLDCSSCCCLP